MCTSEEIRSSRFFDGLDWDGVRNRQVQPSWMPYCADDDEDVNNFPFDVTDRTPPTSEHFAECNRNAPSDGAVHITAFSYVSPAIRTRASTKSSVASSAQLKSWSSSTKESDFAESLPFCMERATPIFDDWGGAPCWHKDSPRDSPLLNGLHELSVEDFKDAVAGGDDANGSNEWDQADDQACFSMSL